MDLIDYSDCSLTYTLDDLDKIISNENWFGNNNEKPLIEQQLFKLQSEYYRTTGLERKNVWDEMFLLSKKYGQSFIQQRLKSRRFESPDEIDEKSSAVALNFMSQYTDRPGFHCGASFGSMICKKVLEVLYKQKPDDQNLSLNAIIGDSNNSVEDLYTRLNAKHLWSKESSKTDFKGLMKSFLNEMEKTELSKIDLVKAHLWIVVLLRKPKNKHTKRCFKNTWCDFKLLKVLDLAELELLNRISEASNDHDIT